MREIKFRARKITSEWAYFTLDQILHHDMEVPAWVWEYPAIEKQLYTNLRDSKGYEIYEGDLFGRMGGDTERPNEYEIHARVYFDNDLGAFCIDDNRGGWKYLSDYLNEQRNEREVIGNIYENPELI